VFALVVEEIAGNRLQVFGLIFQGGNPQPVVGDYSATLIISLALERDADAHGCARIMQVQGCCL